MSTPNIAGLDDDKQPVEVARTARKVALVSADNNNDFQAALGGGDAEGDEGFRGGRLTPLEIGISALGVAILLLFLAGAMTRRMDAFLKQGGVLVALVFLGVFLLQNPPWDIPRNMMGFWWTHMFR